MLTVSATSAGKTDAELVTASRAGDREAFGSIVRRYQTMITGVIYAACGDLHRSEDLAQETFVSAWKSLSGLREPAKLPAWLCQVARHRLIDHSRSESRADARAIRALHHRGEETATSPEEQVLSEEESELLWKTLREIPQPYRETLVLYYRQEKSVDYVALATDTTEANVRQRLARGREMMREQVARMLERNLVRSAPGPAFAIAVVAALPALIPQTAAAATIGVVSLKGGATAKSAGLLSLIAMWIGPILGIFGGILGTWVSIRNAKNPRERKFVVRNAVWIWALVLGFFATLLALICGRAHFGWSNKTYVTLFAGMWIVYTALLTIVVVVQNRRHRAIRREENLPSMTTIPKQGKHFGMGLAGATVGALAWMVNMAWSAGDTASVFIVTFAIAALAITALRKSRDRSIGALHGFTLFYCAALTLITTVMLNWRFHAWIASTYHITLDAARQRIPLWMVNVFIVVIYTFIFLMMHLSLRRTDTSDSRESSPNPAPDRLPPEAR